MAYQRFVSKNRSKIIVGAIFLMLLVLASFFLLKQNKKTKPDFGKNLLLKADKQSNPWLSEAYIYSKNYSRFDSVLENGELVLTVENIEANDARYYQTLRVLPSTIYLFEGDILSEASEGLGANLSVSDVYVFSDSQYDTNGKYVHVKLYGITGPDQQSIKIFARLGGYSGESLGKASFKNLSFSAVENVPSDHFLHNFFKSESKQPAKDAQAAYPLMIVIAGFYVMLFVFISKKQSKNMLFPEKTYTYLMLLVLLFSLFLRLYMARQIPGYGVDIGCFTGWCNQITQSGPSQFYLSDGHSDYPPAYMLVLWLLGLIARTFRLDVNEFLVKLPPIFADIACIFLLFRAIEKRQNKKSALAISALYALNPLIVLTGAGWGQVDSFTSLTLLIVAIYALERKWNVVFPIYVLSVLLKPQALMFGPFGLAAFLLEIYWASKSERKVQLRKAAFGFLYALLLAFFIVLPFSTENKNISWLFDLYGKTLGFYNRASVNSLNIYFLFGLNWVEITEYTPFTLKLLSASLIWAGFAAYILLKHKYEAISKKSLHAIIPALSIGLVLTVFLLLINIKLSLWGASLMLICFLLVFYQYFKLRSIQYLPFFGAMILFLFSNFGTMMHERYLYPAVILLSLACTLQSCRKIKWLLICITVLSFLNVGIVLDRGVRIGGPEAHLSSPVFNITSDSEALEYIISFLNTMLIPFVLSLGFILSDAKLSENMLKNKATQKEVLSSPKVLSSLPSFRPNRLDTKDFMLILLITIVYAGIAFFKLGSFNAPQSSWTSKENNSEIVFDLGENRSFHVLFYPGILSKPYPQTNDRYYFSIETSENMENWENSPAMLAPAHCFTWMYHKTPVGQNSSEFHPGIVSHNGRYVKISAAEKGLQLFEIIFRDIENGTHLPVKLLSGDGQALIDEQSTLSDAPNWYNSMYFDEIYHARTAYEQMKILTTDDFDNIYETTHPPLGKVFMTFSVMLFGMTPFGWRFAGALAGVLMLPGVYLMAKLFTKKRLSALLALLFMAFDFMHYTQTRIATIDSFGTLFIIYATYFMFRYLLIDTLRFKRKLVNLFLSGLSFALACASKWTGFYAGLGLAILFFIKFALDIQKALSIAKKDPSLLSEEEKHIKQNWVKESAITVLACIVFFVLIPFAIYVLSFYPVFKNSMGGLSVQRVIEASKHMLSYHAEPGRGIDHPYYSPWYRWPFSQLPMYYFSGGRVQGSASNIFAFGNPIVWYCGLISMIAVFVCSIQTGRKAISRPAESFFSMDKRAWFILIAFMAQFLPWALVPRGTYIYHYFPSVPFIILAAAYTLDSIMLINSKTGKSVAIFLIVLSALAFVLFFPYISGFRAPFSYLRLTRWFPGIFY